MNQLNSIEHSENIFMNLKEQDLTNSEQLMIKDGAQKNNSIKEKKNKNQCNAELY